MSLNPVNTNKLRYSSLDVNQLKSSLVSWLQSNTQFSQFNANAANWSVLLDLLSYYAYQLSLSANIALNETFLSTATLRPNVVARANEMGYFATSARSSTAAITLTITNVAGKPPSITLPQYTVFSSSVNQTSFNFVTTSASTAYSQQDQYGNTFYTFNLTIKEGMPTQNTFSYTQGQAIQIQNMDIDTSTLTVTVDINNVQTSFYAPTNFLTVQSTDYVYFIYEGFNSYNLIFGDGTYGYQPSSNAQVQCNYLVSSGASSNGASVFSLASQFSGLTGATINVTTTSIASGGADIQDINSIKTNAIQYSRTQERAVIAQDYSTLIKLADANVADAIAWGGEDNNPPYYGKTIVCVIPKVGEVLTTNDITTINSYMSSKMMPVSGLIFTYPTYVNLTVNATVNYQTNLLSISTANLSSNVQNAIYNYIAANLTSFGGTLNLSSLYRVVDTTDASILSSLLSFQLYYINSPQLYSLTSTSFSFANGINTNQKSYTFISNQFQVSGNASPVWFQDDLTGNIHLYTSTNGNTTIFQSNVGTINYVTGNVSIGSLTYTGIPANGIVYTANPQLENFSSEKQIILQCNLSDITVTVNGN